MMKKKILTFILIIISMSTAKPVKIGGTVESFHSVKINKDADLTGQRNKVELDFRKINTVVFMHASIRGTHNPVILEDDFELEISEAYIEYFRSSWDLRIGRQLFNWGKADGIRITDVLSPFDYREFITRDFEEIRMPVEAVKIHWLFSAVDAELIWIPFFTPAKLPDSSSNPWYVDNPLRDMVTEWIEPEFSIENSELAARISVFLNSVDIAFSVSYVFDDMPTYRKTSAAIVGEYNRQVVTGIGVAKPIGIAVMRFEGAYVDGKHFKKSEGDLTTEKPSAKALIGLDLDPGNNWMISTQIANEQHIFNYESSLVNYKDNWLMTLNIEKTFFREKLILTNMLYMGLEKTNLWEHFSTSYALTDDFNLAAGIVLFEGDENGAFGRYDENDAFWLKATFNF